MIKAFISAKLLRQLAASVLAAFVFSAGLYFAVSPIIMHTVCAHYASNPAITQEKANEMLNMFTVFAREHNIAVSDSAMISHWIERHPLLIMQVHRNGRLLYDSTIASLAALHTHHSQQAPPTHQSCQTVLFSDGPASVSINVFPEYATVDWLTKALLGVCGLLFLMIMLLSIRKKVRYLVRLQQEVLAIAGGDLDLPLTMQGSDELSMLAECVDGMRSTLMTRIREEETRGQKNYDAATTLSHDLRTPLTSLSGYLEVLCRQDLSETQRVYVAKCMDKAVRLKEISDLLFNGFSETAAPIEQLVLLPSEEMVEHWMGEYIEELTAKGFVIEHVFTNESCVLRVQRTSLQRVLDNVFSNIEKYAAEDKPIQISTEREGKIFWVIIKNKPGNDAEMSGNGLGLTICENLMRTMSGTFETVVMDGMFIYRLGWLLKDNA